MAEESEFGRGLVVCLVKFREHFDQHFGVTVGAVHHWHTELDEDDTKLAKDVYLSMHGSYEKAFSFLIELWANGTSDHLYEITVPLPQKHRKLAKFVAELAGLALEIGHGFTGKVWAFEHFEQLHTLSRDAVLQVDKAMGIKNPEWGQW